MKTVSFFKDFFKFIFSLKFLKHIALSLIFGIMLLFVTLYMLKVFSNHGESFSVPNFSGLTIAEVTKLSEKKNLRFEIIDSVYTAHGKKGTVVDQNPPKDFKVKENRRIFLTIKALSPEIIKMPDFINSTIVQAKADIETYGLKIGRITYQPWKYNNIVIDQRFKGESLEPGSDIEKGTKIELILGKSNNIENTISPMLTGLTKAQAEQSAAQAMLNIGSVLYDETVITPDDSINAVVRKQFPENNVSLKPGSEIDIWLSMLNDSANTDIN